MDGWCSFSFSTKIAIPLLVLIFLLFTQPTTVASEQSNDTLQVDINLSVQLSSVDIIDEDILTTPYYYYSYASYVPDTPSWFNEGAAEGSRDGDFAYVNYGYECPDYLTAKGFYFSELNRNIREVWMGVYSEERPLEGIYAGLANNKSSRIWDFHNSQFDWVFFDITGETEWNLDELNSLDLYYWSICEYPLNCECLVQAFKVEVYVDPFSNPRCF